MPGLCGASLVVVIALAWAVTQYGSLRHAWLSASGVRLVVEPPSVRLEEGKPGDDRDATFLLYNLSARPVRILGVKTNCGCVSTDKLPTTVPPRGIKELRVTLHLEKSPTGVVEQTLVYHTDEPTTPSFAVEISGRVSEP